MTTPPNCCWDVIVVGAGVAGCSAAYHLQQTAGINRLLVVEAGTAAGQGLAPRQSGSATMPDEGRVVKMMVQHYASTSAEFIHHHGEAGATRYLNATRQGFMFQKQIAHEIWQNDCDNNMKELGSYCVAYEADEATLKQEYETLLKLGCEQDGIEWCEKERLATVEGMSDKFYCGIYFPKEAVIDSSLYAKALLQHVLDQSQGQAKFMPSTPVQDVKQTEAEGGACAVSLKSGETLKAKHVVVATGALHQHSPLNGILKPCYSYLVHVPTTLEATNNKECCQYSPNFWTWGFTHDWCYTNGKIRMSGEDHFSAYKPPKLAERCANLSRWTLEHYDCPVNVEEIAQYPQQYGLYSETPDLAPLIGPLVDSADGCGSHRICYLLGCNAWGQTILSYCASLVPGLLGYKPLTPEQEDALKLVSIQRFSELPSK